MDRATRSVASGPVTRDLLAAVSRSFYLSLRVLPGAVRQPLSVGYLLARASDAIADSAARPATERVALLVRFREALDSGASASFLEAAAACGAAVTHAGERVLLRRLGECFAAAAALPDVQRVLVKEVMERILRGQTLDLERFPDATMVRALPDAAALDEYTWLVAGCVGEFWTAACAEAVPRFAVLPATEMIRLGVDYGKGLQLVNILRDLPGDLKGGRCYLPLTELREAGAGGDLCWPAADWKPWHVVRRRWIGAARTRLAAGRDYVRALRFVRLRLAAVLPLLIGNETLDLLEAQSDAAPPAVAKVPRARVKALLRRGLWLALRPGGL